MMRAAAIDIGTNSILLTVGERTGEGAIVAVHEQATITRLGQGVDERGVLLEVAIERSLKTLAAYAQAMAEHGVQRRAVVGTSALRDAANSDDFLREAERTVGVPVEVISGQREAELCLLGVQTGGFPAERSTLIFDVGGGSTEFICSKSPGDQPSLVSLDIGTVRLTERHISQDPPKQAELDGIRADVHQALEQLDPSHGNFEQLIGVAGTVTTMAAIAMRLSQYDSRRINSFVLEKSEVLHQIGLFTAKKMEARRNIPGLHPKRADVIIAGALIVESILRHFDVQQCTVSDRGVRWGLLDRLLSGSLE